MPEVLVALVALVRLVPALPVAVRVQVSAALALVLVAAPVVLVAHLLVLQASVASALVLAVAVAAAALLAPSVRVAHAVHQRRASRSVRNAKSSNKEWLLASVVQLCHVAMAPRCYVCAAARASKTSQTRLMPMPVS